MDRNPLDQSFQTALRHHQAGQFPQAEQLYRQILARQPNHVDALHHLGVLAAQAGRNDAAVELIRRAISIKPDWPQAYSNLGNALREMGELDEAIAAYRQAITLKSNYSEAHQNLGNALLAKGQLDQAIASYGRAIALKPDYPEAHNNLGNALWEKGQLDGAIAAFRKAVVLKPRYPEAYSNLGNALRKCGQLEEAIAAYRQAITLNPNFAEAHYNFGNALREKGQLQEAIAAYRRAIAINPNYVEAHGDLGNALQDKGQFDEAIAEFRQSIALKPNLAEAHYNLGNALWHVEQLDGAVAACRKALSLKPDIPEAHNSLGNSLKDMGQLDEAVASYRRAIALRPDYAEAHSNLLIALNYHPGFDGQAIAEELRRWNTQHAEPLRKFILPHCNDRSPGRRLRIGYFSPRFRAVPEGRFLLPLIQAHNRSEVEVFCYSDCRKPDAMTELIRQSADEWRDIVDCSDENVAELVRRDQIDVAVDLMLHGSHNRLRVFARKPAPVQVSYLAYCASTGLETIDYRLSDSYLDPPGGDESIYSEQTIRLPETYWCYQPFIAPIEAGPLPALTNGRITFGCLNNFCKISEPILASWSTILRAIPNSQLLLHAHEGSHRQRVQDQLNRQGVESGRIKFVGYMPTAEYFNLYRQIDIALDTSPYGGGTTTFDAMWMGVPVVSLTGKTAVGRAGLSILSNAGVPELVGRSPEQYEQIAVKLATDLPRLSNLRSTLRRRMEQSPLMDAPHFARNVEAAYREMWRRWCTTMPAAL